ncbi:hypothetical protein JOC86_003871 [Bacillus pakistanensis]|uniref:Sigma factor regulator C-terminal domain-containing protein n=1 Tax=Rossellomorea pakistanensis TaxID=992288 RepID=A0ABS2NHK0_9BACI|nr:anti sigma factor C-terminal domain-containing protein [Bacillus pakistanensis]MBM7587298.1 hypothetical protein [Bacillus pakistanensis]
MSKENEFIPKDYEFENLVKKAKRRSLFKMVLISLIISLIVLTGLYFIGDSVMKIKMDRETNVDMAWNGIMGANIEEKGTSFNYTPISATATTEFVKKLGEVPIPWGEKEKVFTIFGTSRLITSTGPSGSGTTGDERIPLYFQGERVIEFYHPQVEYRRVFDDRNLLNKIDDNTVVELAFSLDKGYSIDEVQKLFKNHLAWFWVDTFNKSDIKEDNELNKDKRISRDHTINGFEAYGFQSIDHPEAVQGSNFISTLQMLRSDGGNNQDEAIEIYNSITDNGKDKLVPHNLKIIGVVVTGKPSELKKYNEIPFIRGATLGATADNY